MWKCSDMHFGFQTKFNGFELLWVLFLWSEPRTLLAHHTVTWLEHLVVKELGFWWCCCSLVSFPFQLFHFFFALFFFFFCFFYFCLFCFWFVFIFVCFGLVHFRGVQIRWGFHYYYLLLGEVFYCLLWGGRGEGAGLLSWKAGSCLWCQQLFSFCLVECLQLLYHVVNFIHTLGILISCKRV